MVQEDWILNLEDNEWPLTTIDHDRMIARAIVVDDEGCFYFVRANRDDDFGKATLIEMAGGGVETGEDLDTAIRRELKEELGADVEVLCKIGVVSDYYNLINRHEPNDIGHEKDIKDYFRKIGKDPLRYEYKDPSEEGNPERPWE